MIFFSFKYLVLTNILVYSHYCLITMILLGKLLKIKVINVHLKLGPGLTTFYNYFKGILTSKSSRF